MINLSWKIERKGDGGLGKGFKGVKNNIVVLLNENPEDFKNV